LKFSELVDEFPEQDNHISILAKHVAENEVAEKIKYGPKISFVMITARMDYPYTGRPDLHIFEPTLASFKAQTMKDFELIIVDHLYDDRKDYFKDKNLPFKVKHVSARPNVWHDVGLCGVCTQYNKGIIHADGELLYFMGEGYLFTPEFCEKLWLHYNEGYIPLVWYFFDNSFTPNPIEPSEKWEKWRKAYPEDAKAAIPYNILGYTGQNITFEHRPLVAFKGNDIEVYRAPWEWFFGCSSTPLQAMLKINGFDTRFDGDRMLLDCDVGSRLQLAGFEKFALFKDLFTIRIWSDINLWNPKLPKDAPTVKCNLPLIHWSRSRSRNRFRANDGDMTDEDIRWMKEEYCGKQCQIREQCRTEHPWQFPFEHKEGYGHKSQKKWFDFWRTHQEKIDLVEEREKRISGDKKYQEGTFTT